MASNAKLQEERNKAIELLKASEIFPGSFNLSDLKADKTLFFDSPQNNNQRSPFKASEISARSTALMRKKIPNHHYGDMDFDEIMRTSVSADVRSKYRESIGMGLPHTADVSLRTSVSSNSVHKGTTEDFWGPGIGFTSSFNHQSMSMMSEEFRPAEEMAEKMRNDEIEQEQEYAPIPNVQPAADLSSWEDRTNRQSEMSFGTYCQPFLPNAFEVFGNKSPAKRSNRVAMVDFEKLEDSVRDKARNRYDIESLQKLLKHHDTPEAKAMIMNFHKKQKKFSAEKNTTQEDVSMSGICEMINSVDFKEVQYNENVAHNKQEVPVRDRPQFLQVPEQSSQATMKPPSDALNRNENSFPSRGLKRRSSSAANETPKSTLDKCMRSKSPSQHVELKAAAATLLKPKIEENFKVPNSFSKSPSASRQMRCDFSSTSREYYSAMSITSSEKLSLPNYGLQRPDNVLTSPTSSVRSSSRMSPQEGQLKRASSQLSTGSEFQDEVLPLKIKKNHQKISFESVKLNKKSTRTVTIQNSSNKKLPLRVRIQGAGFTVTPREDFRMTAKEARSFEVEFSPSVVGPARGELVFELMTNSRCSILIPLFGYGGHAAFRLGGVQKGPTGPAFINMGHMNNLNAMMSQTLNLTNHGTLPGYAKLDFKNTKLSDFKLSDSLQMSPTEVHLMPGESTNVRIRFKATKEEIRKILKLNKEVTIVGEIYIVNGDEATRLRLLKTKANLPHELVRYLPEKWNHDELVKRELVNFNENLDNAKVDALIEKTWIHEVALTVNRSLDETQIIAVELSMTEDNMSFMTFCETNNTIMEQECDDDTIRDDNEYLESRLFRVKPAQMFFNRITDLPNCSKTIIVESSCSENLFAEAVSSRHDIITAVKSCGVIKPGESVEIKVTAKPRAFQSPYVGTVFVTLLIDNAKVEIPVKFVD